MTVQEKIIYTANRYGVPPELALAVAEQESSFNQAAIGSKGEVGVYQLMPTTAQDLQVDPYNLDQNIEGGIRYLAQQYSRFGNWSTALQAYNAGPGRVQRGTVPQMTIDYVQSVMSRTTGYTAPPTEETTLTPTFQTTATEFVPPDPFQIAPPGMSWTPLLIGLAIGGALMLATGGERSRAPKYA